MRDESTLRERCVSVPPADNPYDDGEDWNSASPVPPGFDQSHLENDVGYSDSLVAEFDGSVRYLEERGSWLLFDQSAGWCTISEAGVKARAADFARKLYRQATRDAESLPPQDGLRELRKAAALGFDRRICAALSLARCHPCVSTRVETVDRDANIVGVANGVLNLADGRLKPFDKSTLVLGRLGTHFDPSARCPAFDAFLTRVQPDEEIRRFLQRLTGYALSGEIREHVLPFHYGIGANGKSTFLEMTLLRLMGSYGGKVSNSLVYVNDRGASPALEIACIAGKRFLLGEENSDGASLNEVWLKSATGGDRQKGRFHRESFFEYDPTYKLALVGNHHPRIDGTDNGIWRRFLLVKWEVCIPKEEQDPKLPATLADELPGILNWALAGYRDWADNGLAPPASCTIATDDFRTASDRLAEFIEDTFERDEGGEISKKAVFDAYLQWANSEGVSRPMSQRGLAFQLRARGWAEARTTESRVWLGWRKRGWS